MEQTNQIGYSISTFRATLDMYINSFPYLMPSREVSLAHTHCQRAFMWLGKALGETGSETPYKEANNPDSKVIEPTADHGATSLMDTLWDMVEPTQTARVKSFRAQIAEYIKNFKEWRLNDSGKYCTDDYQIYLSQSKLAMQEASMWFGWELARIRKELDPNKSKTVNPELLPKSL